MINSSLVALYSPEEAPPPFSYVTLSNTLSRPQFPADGDAFLYKKISNKFYYFVFDVPSIKQAFS